MTDTYLDRSYFVKALCDKTINLQKINTIFLQLEDATITNRELNIIITRCDQDCDVVINWMYSINPNLKPYINVVRMFVNMSCVDKRSPFIYDMIYALIYNNAFTDDMFCHMFKQVTREFGEVSDYALGIFRSTFADVYNFDDIECWD